jgi:hypothetical protein
LKLEFLRLPSIQISNKFLLAKNAPAKCFSISQKNNFSKDFSAKIFPAKNFPYERKHSASGIKNRAKNSPVKNFSTKKFPSEEFSHRITLVKNYPAKKSSDEISGEEFFDGEYHKFS